MEILPQLKCVCGHCNGTIEYPPDAAGQIIECPHCKEKTLLPKSNFKMAAPTGPPVLRTCPDCGCQMEADGVSCAVCARRRRRTLSLVLGVVAALAVPAVGWLFLKKFYAKPAAQQQRPAFPAHMVIEQPLIKTVKTMKDFKISPFWLETKRGSDLVIAVGDISNMSGNVYLRLKADADLLDARGTKIGTVTDHLNELIPGKTWRFIATVTDARAKSVRFVSVKEQ